LVEVTEKQPQLNVTPLIINQNNMSHTNKKRTLINIKKDNTSWCEQKNV